MIDLIIILKSFSIPFLRLAGKLSWRFGRPFRCPKARVDQVSGKIKPGMVVLTRKEYEFSNLLIRGYWTHSAMIVSERDIVEAVSQGVTRKSLDEFFTAVDDFIILEPRFCGASVMEKATEFAKNVIGYAYNYYFIPRQRSFFCTELILNAYAHASGRELPGKSITRKAWDFAGGNDYSPQRLAELERYWRVI